MNPQPITAADINSVVSQGMGGQTIITGTPTPGSVVQISTPGSAAAAVRLSGAFSANLQVEKSFDGGTVWHQDSVIPFGMTDPISVLTTKGVAHCNSVLTTQMRVRCTSFTTGPINAAIELSDTLGDLLSGSTSGDPNVADFPPFLVSDPLVIPQPVGYLGQLGSYMRGQALDRYINLGNYWDQYDPTAKNISVPSSIIPPSDLGSTPVVCWFDGASALASDPNNGLFQDDDTLPEWSNQGSAQDAIPASTTTNYFPKLRKRAVNGKDAILFDSNADQFNIAGSATDLANCHKNAKFEVIAVIQPGAIFPCNIFGNTNSSLDIGFALELTATNQINAFIANGAAAILNLSTVKTLYPGKWYIIDAWADATNIYISVDGAPPEKSANVSGSPSASAATRDYAMGGVNSVYFYSGSIQTMAVWLQPLSKANRIAYINMLHNYCRF